MAIDNEELMGKLVRTGMIMRHIDGEGRGHGHGHGSRTRDHEGQDHGRGHREGGREDEGHGCKHGHHGEHRRGQARVLTMISMQEGINQKDLAFLLGIRPQTLGAMLQKLEERGLVARKKSEADGRAIEVSLTDEGRVKAAEIAERRALAAADIFAALTEDEKEQLASILDKLGAELDKHRPEHHGKKHRAEATEAE